MCGRIAQSEPSRYAQRLAALSDVEPEWEPSWNIGPTATVLGVRERRAPTGEVARTLTQFSWGLLPGWCDSPSQAARSFNARSETVATKPLFRGAFRARRLLVPVDGFYEWAAEEGGSRKQPYFFSRADGEPVVLAGLWEYWRRGDDQRRTATVLTVLAGPDMPIHDRQPVVLEPGSWDRWLDPDVDDTRALRALLVPGSGVLVRHPVSKDVGSVRNDGPHLVEAVPAAG